MENKQTASVTPQAQAAVPAVNGAETAEQRTIRELNERLNALVADNATLKARVESARQPGSVSFKASEKGALSLYGLGRFPVTLYKGQWQRVIELVKNGRLEAAIEQFGTALKEKEAK
jgi:hypothetical protein